MCHLDLLKNHGQLHCRTVVLCWPVISLESGDDIVGGTTARIAVQFLPNNVYPLSVDFANFLSKNIFFKSRGVKCLPFNLNYAAILNLFLSPSLSANVAFFMELSKNSLRSEHVHLKISIHSKCVRSATFVW